MNEFEDEDEIEFCPCGDLPAYQCDGEMCEEFADMFIEEEGGTFAVMPSGLSPEEIANFDY